MAVRVPERTLRLALALTLLVVAAKLAVDEWNSPTSMVQVFRKRAPH
jgi:hypothetical protein